MYEMMQYSLTIFASSACVHVFSLHNRTSVQLQSSSTHIVLSKLRPLAVQFVKYEYSALRCRLV